MLVLRAMRTVRVLRSGGGLSDVVSKLNVGRLTLSGVALGSRRVDVEIGPQGIVHLGDPEIVNAPLGSTPPQSPSTALTPAAPMPSVVPAPAGPGTPRTAVPAMDILPGR